MRYLMIVIDNHIISLFSEFSEIIFSIFVCLFELYYIECQESLEVLYSTLLVNLLYIHLCIIYNHIFCRVTKQFTDLMQGNILVGLKVYLYNSKFQPWKRELK